jgi:TolB protein
MQKIRYLSIFLVKTLLIFLLSLHYANASTVISVSNNKKDKLKILFIGFESRDQAVNGEARKIFYQIENNLKTTNLFDTEEYRSIIEEVNSDLITENNEPTTNVVNQNNSLAVKEIMDSSPLDIDSMPRFDKFQAADIDFLMIAEPSFEDNGYIKVKLRAWDIADERQVIGKFYSSSIANYRKMSNIVSNEIYKSLTGEKYGHFDSKIAYISEIGPASKRIKKINIINFDGSSRNILTDGKDLVLTPSFANKVDEIFYLRYFDNRPQVFKINSNTLATKRIGNFKGTTFAASPHPKNRNLVLLSVIIDGNSDIYELDIASNTARKLTNHPAIDTTASYSPDGTKITFSSDRENGQQIYIADSNGGNVRRISNNGGSYSKPVWSPDGKMIAFTKIKGNQFYIGTMLTDGKNERILSSGYLVEGAKWSLSSRYLVYSKKKSKFGFDSIPKLYVVDVLTGYEFKLNTPDNEGATDPDWYQDL